MPKGVSLNFLESRSILSIFSSSLIAIDIGSSAIKLVELGGKLKNKIVSLGFEPLPPGAMVGGVIQEKDPIQLALKNLISRHKLRTFLRRASTSLGGNSVILKKVNFQADEGNIDEAIYYQAEQHLQYDMNDLYFDYAIQESELVTTQVPVVLVGAKRETVDERLALLKSIKLKIGVVDCDVFALVNGFEHSYGSLDGVIVLADVGAASTQVVFIGHGRYLYSREISISGESYTKALSAEFGLSYADADKLKIDISLGKQQQPRAQQIIKELNQQFASDLQAIFEIFFQSGESLLGVNTAQAIFLAGGAARTWSLTDDLSLALQVPVAVMNPFQNVTVPKNFISQSLYEQSHLFGVAHGLGLRSFIENK
jgi:type IV pilus assembly protein PilM